MEKSIKYSLIGAFVFLVFIVGLVGLDIHNHNTNTSSSKSPSYNPSSNNSETLVGGEHITSADSGKTFTTAAGTIFFIDISGITVSQDGIISFITYPAALAGEHEFQAIGAGDVVVTSGTFHITISVNENIHKLHCYLRLYCPIGETCVQPCL